MNHQIALVGGQLLPVYLGIKEYDPSHVHFIVSRESRDRVSSIQNIINNKKISEYYCDPYSFTSVISTMEQIVSSIGAVHEIQINLTGGTKIMFLAAQFIIQNKKVKGFYINQNETVLFVPEFKESKLAYNLSIQEFLQLSGHKLTKSKSFEDFSAHEVNEAFSINDFIIKHEQVYNKVNAELRKKINAAGGSLPKQGNIGIENNITLEWDHDNIHVKQKEATILQLNSKSSRVFFFYAGWWEYIVAAEIRKWGKAKEIFMQCEIPFRQEANSSKNEIDILLNLGKKLIFIECKSGAVAASDINKMKTTKDTYGGLISKTILVSRFKPSLGVIEKCNELEIDIFFLYDNKTQVNKLEDLINSLEVLEQKFSIL
jgi:hypothetical protein